MRIDTSRPSLRSLHTPLMWVEVVTPSGHIKRVMFDRHVQSDMIRVEWAGNKCVAVHIDTLKKDAGYELLHDLYQAEDRMDDFEARCDYVRACLAGNVGRVQHKEEVFHAEKGTREMTYDVAQPFPDNLLPKAVLDRRAGKLTGKKWEPPKKNKKTG